VDAAVAAKVGVYGITTYTHVYDAGYGSPEVDQTTPKVLKAEPAADGMSVVVQLDRVVEDHIHDFDLSGMVGADGRRLLHHKAYYTVNEVPRE
jgi:hypothetical protein